MGSDEAAAPQATSAAGDDAPATARRRGPRLATLLKLGVAVGLIALLIRRGFLDVGALQRALEQPLRLVPVMILAATGISISAVRWLLLLRAEGIHISLLMALRLTWIGHFFNMVFPGAVSGDAVKMYYVGFLAPGRREEAWTTVLADRIVGLMALVSLATVSSLVNVSFMWARPPLRATLLTMVAILLCALLGGAALALGLGERLTSSERFASLPGGALLVRAVRVLTRLTRRPGLLALGLVISAFAHGLAVTNAFLLSRIAIPGQHLGYLDYLAMFPVALFSNAIPISPGGIGVGEGVLGKLFAWSGGNAADGVTVMILYRAVFYVLALFGALNYMVYKRGEPPRPQASSACDGSP